MPRIAVDGLGADPEDLRCLIAVFGHGDGVAGSIARVDRLLAVGTPARLRGPGAVQAALSSDPAEDTPGTLYLNWLFKPAADSKLVEDIYTYTLPVALCAALTGAPKARMTWDRDDEIASRVMTGGGAHSRWPAVEESVSCGSSCRVIAVAATAAFVRGEPGLSLDHDRGGLRIPALDGREVVVSGVDVVAFDRIVALVGEAANGPR